jgi:hypothetical protein
VIPSRHAEYRDEGEGDRFKAPIGFSNELVDFCIVSGSSILFCSKGVFAKLAYGVGALTVLTLRTAFVLPFFVVLVVFSSRTAAPLDIRDWTKLAGLDSLNGLQTQGEPARK